jgi:hypothetical protein
MAWLLEGISNILFMRLMFGSSSKKNYEGFICKLPMELANIHQKSLET